MTVILDDNLIHKAELTQIIEAAGIQCEATKSPLIDKSFGFKRELIYQALGDDLQVNKVSTVKFVYERMTRKKLRILDCES